MQNRYLGWINFEVVIEVGGFSIPRYGFRFFAFQPFPVISHTSVKRFYLLYFWSTLPRNGFLFYFNIKVIPRDRSA